MTGLSKLLFIDDGLRELMEQFNKLEKSDYAAASLYLNQALYETLAKDTPHPIEKEEEALTEAYMEQMRKQFSNAPDNEIKEHARIHMDTIKKAAHEIVTKTVEGIDKTFDSLGAHAYIKFSGMLDTAASDLAVDQMIDKALAKLPEDVSKLILKSIMER